MSTYEDRMTAAAMRRNPQYAQFMLRDKSQDPGVQEANLANAYAAMEQRLARDEANRQQAHLMKRGDVPIPMRKPEYQMPSPIEQWGQKISAMVKSGNPTLQAEGIKQMQKYQEEQIPKGVDEAKRSASAQIALDLGYQPGTKPFNDFIMQHSLRPASTTNINMGGNKPLSKDELLSLVDKDGYPATNLPANLTADQAAERGLSFGRIATEGEAKGEGSFEASIEMLDRLSALTGGEDGARLFGLEGVIANYRSGSEVGAALLNAALDTFGVKKTPQTVEAMAITTSLGNQLLQAFRGASVGPEEKADFIKQLPTPGQSEEQFNANKKLTMRNLAIINERKEKARGINRPDREPAAPPGSKPWKPGDGPSEGLFWVD